MKSLPNKIFSIAVLFLILFLVVAHAPANAAPNNNPVFATLQFVQDAINAAIAPIQTSLQGLTSRVTNIETALQTVTPAATKIIHVVDYNNQSLGILIDHNQSFNTVYSPTLNRFIYLKNDSFANQIALLFESSDCTGTPYSPAIGEQHNAMSNDVLPYGQSGVYYNFQDSQAPLTVTTGSQGNYNNNTHQTVCTPDVRTNIQVYRLYPVELPFSVPLAMPLQFKYQ